MAHRRDRSLPRERLKLIDMGRQRRFYELQRCAGDDWRPIARFPVPTALARMSFRVQWLFDRERLIEENRVARLGGGPGAPPGAGSREPRRPIRPLLSGGAELPLPDESP
jgi:hypothetical protein